MKYVDAACRAGAPDPRSASGLADGRTSPSIAVARREEAERLDGALARLPEPERRAVESYVLEARSFTQIAAESGISRAGAWNNLQAGLERLRSILRAGEPSS